MEFIEKARVLAEAYEVKEMFPDKLNNRTSTSFQVGSVFEDELSKLRMRVAESRRALDEKRRIRDSLKSENVNFERSYQKYKQELQQSCSIRCGLQVFFILQPMRVQYFHFFNQ